MFSSTNRRRRLCTFALARSCSRSLYTHLVFIIIILCASHMISITLSRAKLTLLLLLLIATANRNSGVCFYLECRYHKKYLYLCQFALLIARRLWFSGLQILQLLEK